jgi:hypothetical protein
MQQKSGCVDVTLSAEFTHKTKGMDSNVNIALLRANCIVARLMLESKSRAFPKVLTYSVSEFAITHTTDVSQLKLVDSPTPGFSSKKTNNLIPNSVQAAMKSYLDWVSSGPTYDSFRSTTKMHSTKIPNENDVDAVAGFIVDYFWNEEQLPWKHITLPLIGRTLDRFKLETDSQVVFDLIHSQTVMTEWKSDSLHQKLRDHIADSLNLPDASEKAVHIMWGSVMRVVIKSVIARRCLMFVECDEHQNSGCVRLSRDLTRFALNDLHKSYDNEDVGGDLENKEMDENQALFWISLRGFLKVLDELFDEGILNQCHCVEAPSVGGISFDEEFPVKELVQVHDHGQLSAEIYNLTEELVDLLPKAKALQVMYDAFGEPHTEEAAAFALMKALGQVIDPEDIVLDVCAGSGNMAYGAHFADVNSDSIAIPDTWLRHGVYRGVTVKSGHDAMNPSTWGLVAQLSQVLLYDTSNLYGSSSADNSTALPDTINMLVFRFTKNTHDALKVFFDQFESLVCYKYVVIIKPCWRHMYIILSTRSIKSEFGLKRAIRQTMSYVQSHISLEPLLYKGSLLPSEMCDIFRGYVRDILLKTDGQASIKVKKSFLSNALMLKEISSACKEGENVIDAVNRINDEPKESTPREIAICKSLLEEHTQFTLENVLYDSKEDDSLTKTFKWILQAHSAGCGVSAGEFFMTHKSLEGKLKPRDLKQLSMIRLWITHANKTIAKFPLLLKKETYVIKERKKDEFSGKVGWKRLVRTGVEHTSVVKENAVTAQEMTEFGRQVAALLGNSLDIDSLLGRQSIETPKYEKVVTGRCVDINEKGEEVYEMDAAVEAPKGVFGLFGNLEFEMKDGWEEEALEEMYAAENEMEFY